MFQFRRFPPYNYVFIIRSIPLPVLRFPHSEIHGSQPIRGSPWLIAAYHVLLRLPVTRHSPCALFSLTFCSVSHSFGKHRKKTVWPFLFSEVRNFVPSDLYVFCYRRFLRSTYTSTPTARKQRFFPRNLCERWICPNYSYSLDCFTWIIWVFSVIVVTEISFSYLLYFIT